MEKKLRKSKNVQKNEKFSQNILVALREVAEEKEHSKSLDEVIRCSRVQYIKISL